MIAERRRGILTKMDEIQDFKFDDITPERLSSAPTIPLTYSEEAGLFLAQVSIGTPGQESSNNYGFPLIFVSGYSGVIHDFNLVAGVGCTGCPQSVYNPYLSSTAYISSYTSEYTFEGASANGFFVEDNVCLNGAT